MKKRNLILLMFFVLGTIMGCHDITEGYLETEKASYEVNTLTVRKTPDPVRDAVRIRENAPWVSLALEGYLGTEPIRFSIEGVTSPDAGAEAARLFMEELSIRGGGTLQYPLKNNAVAGTYIVSIRLTNDGYSKVVKDCFTFTVVE